MEFLPAYKVLIADEKEGVRDSLEKHLPVRKPACDIAHALNNAHSSIRMKCEGFVLDYEEGMFGQKSHEVLVKESIEILRDVVDIIDASEATIDMIRKL